MGSRSALCPRGIIPAHAGFTSSHDPLCVSPDGSSPHTRGLRPHTCVTADTYRIIPAHAGFTPSCDRCHVTATDHPRTRGVYPQRGSGPRSRPGSSPHTRGLPGGGLVAGGQGRIIPAHAGFTRHHEHDRERDRDHPRTRGVYVTTSQHAWASSGSSPHTRGLPGQALCPAQRDGIIPAHAGFTCTPSERGCDREDHPRTRGVYDHGYCTVAEEEGSSPHTRGLPWVPPRGGCDGGIIPAHAGFTLGDPWNPNGPGVYHPPVSFTADLVPARRSCGSAAVEPRWTTTPWAA